MQEDRSKNSMIAQDDDSGAAVTGYEIHIGQTTGPDCDRAWLRVAGRPEGAADPSGRVLGCYLHGIFTADGFRAGYLAQLGAAGVTGSYADRVDQTLDALADHLEQHLDIDALLALARPVSV